jgi:PAS domain S-box-containing protein
MIITSKCKFLLGIALCIGMYFCFGESGEAKNIASDIDSPKSYKETPYPNGKTIRVGVSHNPPLASHGNGEPPQGLVIDIIRNVAKTEKWNLEFIEKPRPQLLKLLDIGQLDLLGGIAYSSGRARKYNFSNEAAANNWAVIYRDKNTKIRGIGDLNGKKIAVIPQSVHASALQNLSISFALYYEEIPAKDYAHALELVDSGEADVGVVARTFHLLHGSKYQAFATTVRFNPIEIRFATPKGKGSEILAALDSYLLVQKNDPDSSYTRSLDRWFKGPLRREFPEWIYWVAFVGMAGLLLTVMFIFILKNQVKIKTNELSMSEKRYRGIFENAAEGIFQSTPDGRFISANSAMAKILGYISVDDLMNSVTDIGAQLFCNADDRTACVDILRSVGEFKGKEVLWKQKDGTSIWLLGSVRSSTNNFGEPYFDGTIQDITKRKQAEEKLSESAARFRDFAKVSSDWFWEVDADFKITFLSGRYKEITNVEITDAIGKRFQENFERLQILSDPSSHTKCIIFRRGCELVEDLVG